MNLALALPLGLSALASVLVALLIHLRRRSEQHRTAFAALRWLPPRARPRTRLRFEEWPLLLVRLLLLVALALLLAEPLLFGGPHAKRWLVVAPGVAADAIPSADAFRGERRWLASGFPDIELAPPRSPQPVGSLLRELDATLPADTRLTVLVPALLDGADAVAPLLHRAVEWKVVAGATPRAAAESRAKPRPALVVRHADDMTGLRYLRATALAWKAVTPSSDTASQPDIGPVSQTLPATDKPLAWLASGALPASLLEWVERGGTVLVDATSQVPRMDSDGVALWRSASGEVLVRGLPVGRGRILQWTHPLTPEALPQLLEPDFPERVWSLFAPTAPLPARVAAQDYKPRHVAGAWPERPRDLQPWLILLIAALFVVERLLATGRREVATA